MICLPFIDVGKYMYVGQILQFEAVLQIWELLQIGERVQTYDLTGECLFWCSWLRGRLDQQIRAWRRLWNWIWWRVCVCVCVFADPYKHPHTLSRLKKWSRKALWFQTSHQRSQAVSFGSCCSFHTFLISYISQWIQQTSLWATGRSTIHRFWLHSFMHLL